MAMRDSQLNWGRSARQGVWRAGRMAVGPVLAFAVLAVVNSPSIVQAQGRPTVSVEAVIKVKSASRAALPIQVVPAHAVPRQAFLRIKGLPPTVALSEGHSIAVGAWAVPLAALPGLDMDLPVGSEGRSDITIVLVSVDGLVLSEAKSTLVIERPDRASGPAATMPRVSALRVEPEGPPVPLTSAPAAQPPPAKAPQMAAADRERALKLLVRGNELIASKDFSAAQHFYKRAAEIGLPEAALALARTFDPGELARHGAVGLQPNPEVARTWYEKARALGSTDADAYLLRLSAAR